jgi:hypothetical protein
MIGSEFEAYDYKTTGSQVRYLTCHVTLVWCMTATLLGPWQLQPHTPATPHMTVSE